MASLTNTHADTSLKNPLYVKQEPYHPFSQRTHGIVTGVTSVAAFALPASLTTAQDKTFPGPYMSGSSGWSEMNRAYAHHEAAKGMLHTMVAALQLPNNGCPLFKESRRVETMLAYIRRAERRAEEEDMALLNDPSACTQAHFTDLQVAEVLRSILAGTYNDHIAGREDRQADGDANVLQDGNNIDIRRGYGGGGGGRRRRRQDDEDGGGGPEPMNETDASIMTVIRDALEAVEADRRNEMAAAAEAEDDEDAVLPSHVSEKFKVLVVHMTRPVQEEHEVVVERDIPGSRRKERVTETRVRAKKNRDGTDMMEDAGCVVFLLVMDPFYSLGGAFKKVIDMCAAHRAHIDGNPDNMAGGGGGGGGDGGGGGGRDEDSLGGIGEGGDNYNGGGGGRRRGRGRPSQNMSLLLQTFPWLVDVEHQGNALLRMDMETYINIVSCYNDNTRLVNPHLKYGYIHRGMETPGTVQNPNPLHPLNAFSVERALRIMQLYGVPENQCSMERFRGANAAFEMADNGIGRTWRFPPQDTWQYPIESWAWAARRYAGLSRQLWPWIEVPEELEKLARPVAAPGQIVAYRHDPESDLIGRSYTATLMKPHVGLITPLPLVPYDPHRMLRQNTIWQMSMRNIDVLSKIAAPIDPKNMPDAYAQYCYKIEEMRDIFFKQAQQALVVDAPGLPSSVNHLLMYLAREVNKVSSYLPQLTLDPLSESPVREMDAFAHYMIRESNYLRNYLFVVGPSRQWQMAHYGSKDAYSMTGLKVHYASISRGMSQSGKSWVSMCATIDTSVPGTVQHMLESSNRAFNTHDDFTHTILFKDELENILVSSAAAENDKSGKAERWKSMMTDQKATYQVLTFIDQANGRQRRVSESIETLFHAVLICCTNKRIDGTDEAIASRFLSFVITRSEIDIYEFLDIKSKTDNIDAQKKRDFIHMLCVKQCLIAMAQILIDMQVIPEPSMDAYNMITTRMTAYFEHHGLEPASFTRATQIIARLARVYTILNAVIHVFDAPGAPLFNKVFHLSMLRALTPYLYCTKQITLFVMTQVGEVYYRPLQMMVLSTLLKTADFEYVKGKPLEAYVREDVNHQQPWRRERPVNRAELVDFNYVVIEGDFKSKILQTVANNMRPSISENEAASEIKELSKQKFTTRPLQHMSSEYYTSKTHDETRKLSLPRKPNTVQLPMVIREYKDNRLCIAVEAMDTFKEDMIVEAFLRCIHDGFKDQTFLLGVNHSEPNPVMVARREEENARRMEECLAKGVRFIPDPSPPPIPDYVFTSVYKTLVVNKFTKERYSMGPMFLEKDASFMTNIVKEIVKGPRLHPDAAEDEHYAESAYKRLTPVTAFAPDIDDMAYERHHYRVAIPGSHLDSPAWPDTIRARIRDSVTKIDALLEYNKHHEVPSHKRPRAVQSILLDYPAEVIADEKARLVLEDKARAFAVTENIGQLMLEAERSAYKTMSDEDRRKYGTPTLITAADFTNGGRYANASAAQLRALEEKSAILRLQQAAKKEGKTLTEADYASIRSSAIIPVAATTAAATASEDASAGGGGGGGGVLSIVDRRERLRTKRVNHPFDDGGKCQAAELAQSKAFLFRLEGAQPSSATIPNKPPKRHREDDEILIMDGENTMGLPADELAARVPPQQQQQQPVREYPVSKKVVFSTAATFKPVVDDEDDY